MRFEARNGLVQPVGTCSGPRCPPALGVDSALRLAPCTHPAAAVIRASLAAAGGIPTPPVRLVEMPDDPALGPSRTTFATLLSTPMVVRARLAHSEESTLFYFGSGFAF